MIRAIDDLTPETAAAARAWLADAVAAVPASYRDSVREDLLASLCEAVDPAATPAEFAEAVRPIGAVVIEDDDRPAPNPLVGRCCGVPYDFRPPTGERLRQAMWNPADPHLFAPRAFGVGWNLNVGALAVRLGLIEPDAEDVPFSHVPPRGFAVAAGLPFALAGAVVAHYAARMGVCPCGITVTGARTRFGSCSPKNRLCFSWRLMQYPDAAIDYVVVHELAHIVHKNHGAAFYAAIASVLPNYQDRIRLLKG